MAMATTRFRIQRSVEMMVLVVLRCYRLHWTVAIEPTRLVSAPQTRLPRALTLQTFVHRRTSRGDPRRAAGL